MFPTSRRHLFNGIQAGMGYCWDEELVFQRPNSADSFNVWLWQLSATSPGHDSSLTLTLQLAAVTVSSSININPYAASGLFGQYECNKTTEKWLKPWHMGTHLRGLSESYPMNSNMTGYRCFSKNLCVLVLWMKVASALNVLTPLHLECTHGLTHIYRNIFITINIWRRIWLKVAVPNRLNMQSLFKCFQIYTANSI